MGVPGECPAAGEAPDETKPMWSAPMSYIAPRLLTVPPVVIAGATLDRPITPSELASVVLARAERAFGHRADAVRLARHARAAAESVFSGAPPRLHTFLPDLALRAVRDALENEAA